MSNPRHYQQQPFPVNPPAVHAGGHYHTPYPEPHHEYHETKHTGPRGWSNGMCGCFNECGTCCTGYWCPCILYGKTHHRLRNPTMDGYSCCNGSCMGYAVLATCLSPFYVILGMKQRAAIRRKYNLEGGGCGDYCRSLCCSCCSLIQEEKEVRERASMLPERGYQAPGGMTYGR